MGYIMEDIKISHYRRYFLIGLGLFVITPFVKAEALIQSDAPPSVSIVGLNYAANNTVVFSPRTLRWQAIDSKGKVVRTGRASGGRSYCPDIKRSCRTPSGSYRVISEGGPGCRSSRYPVGKGGAPMPYCMFFSKYYAIHGSPDVPGYNASHGCVRVPTSDARWLNQNFVSVGTRVIVKPY
jgi:lipoprotein-anchoring transpeptidase ErfK/SrfK